ncbi:hypothetical protein PVK06_001675 [Gossypium arboreum]|uniref:Uncharacterized protein n=1 Tax=Gossypium arboreum TaxID=29729 RepID=A0ABR0R1K3_GOSAR|nr:hypothetical protein PVK06_001675 [Gossypium arboreum]
MPEFPTFPTFLLLIPKATKKPTQTPNARVESVNLGATADEGETVPKEPKKTTSLNLEKEAEAKKDETTTTTTASMKGKNPAPTT